MPKPRDNKDGWKDGRDPAFVQPCGVARKATQPSTYLKAGATIPVSWTETVNHPGCFLIDFSKDDKEFQPLLTVPHKTQPAVPRPYDAMITLPAMNCDNCTLRLRQVMTEGLASGACPPAMIPKSALYYSCANVVLNATGTRPGDGGASPAKDAGTAEDARASSDGALAQQPDAASGIGGASGAAGRGGAGGGGGAGGLAGVGGASATGGSSAGGGSSGGPARDAAAGGPAPGTGGDEGDDIAPNRHGGGGCAFSGDVSRGASSTGAAMLVALALALCGARRRRR